MRWVCSGTAIVAPRLKRVFHIDRSASKRQQQPRSTALERVRCRVGRAMRPPLLLAADFRVGAVDDDAADDRGDDIHVSDLV